MSMQKVQIKYAVLLVDADIGSVAALSSKWIWPGAGGVNHQWGLVTFTLFSAFTQTA
jgi:hypothetical protein